MKLLLCSPVIPSRELGISKVLVELADALEQLHWQCTVLSPLEIDPDIHRYTGEQYHQRYAEALRLHLHQHAAHYDIVDYEHVYLPYPRTEFHPSTLMVARSAILVHHLETFPIPIAHTLRGRVGHWVKGHQRKQHLRQRVAIATRTLHAADLINVNNSESKAELMERGIPAHKIAVVPLGLSQDQRSHLQSLPLQPPAEPTIACIGTFEPRKGSNDIPRIAQTIWHHIPAMRLKLLGTHRSANLVLKRFPPRWRDRVQVIPHYPAAELPSLLQSCSVGMAPTYLEGFGLGILEMLAAALPVLAYHVPGPTLMLPPNSLIQRGNWQAMAEQLIALLQDRETLQHERTRARGRSQPFTWQAIARTTADLYTTAYDQRQLQNQSSTEHQPEHSTG